MTGAVAERAARPPQHCGRDMWDVKDRANDNAPIWWCPECHTKLPREEASRP